MLFSFWRSLMHPLFSLFFQNYELVTKTIHFDVDYLILIHWILNCIQNAKKNSGKFVIFKKLLAFKWWAFSWAFTSALQCMLCIYRTRKELSGNRKTSWGRSVGPNWSYIASSVIGLKLFCKPPAFDMILASQPTYFA